MTMVLGFLTSSCKHDTLACPNNAVPFEETCRCLEGYTGINCEIEDPCILSDKECLNDGKCDNGKCHCFGFYRGEECGFYPPLRLAGHYKVTYLVVNQSGRYRDHLIREFGIPLVIERTTSFNGQANYIAVQQNASQSASIWGFHSEQCDDCGDTLTFRFYSHAADEQFDFQVKESGGKLVGEGEYYTRDYDQQTGTLLRLHKTYAFFRAEKLW